MRRVSRRAHAHRAKLNTLSNAEYYMKYFFKDKNKKKLYNTLQEHINEYTFMYQCHNFFTYYEV